MKQSNDYLADFLDLEIPIAEKDTLWRACLPDQAWSQDGDIFINIPFQAQKVIRGADLQMEADLQPPLRNHVLRARAYGKNIVRLSISFGAEEFGGDSAMLDLAADLKLEPLTLEILEHGWVARDLTGKMRVKVDTSAPEVKVWSSLIPPPADSLNLDIFPDGNVCVPLMTYDQFFPRKQEGLPLAYIERAGQPDRTVFAFHALPDEKFAGTGERFARLDLAGKTIVLENHDGLGVNNRRAYKNVPFYLTNRPYGLFMHTSAHCRLSLADISSRAAQGLVEEPGLDLFVIGGGSVAQVVHEYCCLTGFAGQVPLWSYGIWMSRMTYFSADEVKGIVRRLREEHLPCDVIHLDTGWFATDWVCEWEFSQERFPDPPRFFREMLEQGIRISLWQQPNIGQGNRLLGLAQEKRYIPPRTGTGAASASDFSTQQVGGRIDFTNPEAVTWYQGLLARLLKMGAAVIKTDFGEEVDMDAAYQGMPAERLHNLYGLLYQKAAAEITREMTGTGLVWARAGWAGCQRYPVHWGGDSASTWDGMAGSLRGGLHIGLSGFPFWSHDVPGFHGVPDFMNSWPDDDLYVRWTQFGVFSSHMRYHGASPREPYEYPRVIDIVRKWWMLRYALIPYIAREGEKACHSGLPLLRALIFHHPEDPTCWHIDDAYYFGDDLLVAPVMNAAGKRDVYLPAGNWIDFWDGKEVRGPVWLKGVQSPLERLPVYARKGAEIMIYPFPVQSTNEMRPDQVARLRFDANYSGLNATALGSFISL